jgi:hypothetical protein
MPTIFFYGQKLDKEKSREMIKSFKLNGFFYRRSPVRKHGLLHFDKELSYGS